MEHPTFWPAPRPGDLLPPNRLIPVPAVPFPTGRRLRPPLSPQTDGFQVDVQLASHRPDATAIGDRQNDGRFADTTFGVHYGNRIAHCAYTPDPAGSARPHHLSRVTMAKSGTGGRQSPVSAWHERHKQPHFAERIACCVTAISDCNDLYLPLNTGFRFSMKALRPSM